MISCQKLAAEARFPAVAQPIWYQQRRSETECKPPSRVRDFGVEKEARGFAAPVGVDDQAKIVLARTAVIAEVPQ
jgi:hypothetical protein